MGGGGDAGSAGAQNSSSRCGGVVATEETALLDLNSMTRGGDL